jgi:hypothetical protein
MENFVVGLIDFAPRAATSHGTRQPRLDVQYRRSKPPQFENFFQQFRRAFYFLTRPQSTSDRTIDGSYLDGYRRQRCIAFVKI